MDNKKLLQPKIDVVFKMKEYYIIGQIHIKDKQSVASGMID